MIDVARLGPVALLAALTAACKGSVGSDRRRDAVTRTLVDFTPVGSAPSPVAVSMSDGGVAVASRSISLGDGGSPAAWLAGKCRAWGGVSSGDSSCRREEPTERWWVEVGAPGADGRARLSVRVVPR